jgi:hypothetical protein
MLKFTYKGHFLTIKKAYNKLLYWKFKWWEHAFCASSTYRIYKNIYIKIPIFGGISTFLKLIVIGQILTEFDSFGLFRANSAATAMADSIPLFERKKINHHNFCIKYQNLACNGLLESPLNFPSIQKVSKNPITNWNRTCMPKIPKFRIWNSQSFRG